MNSHLLQVGESAVAVTPAGLSFLCSEQLSHHPFRRWGRHASANGSGLFLFLSAPVPSPTVHESQAKLKET
jgi:hypothetical protein